MSGDRMSDTGPTQPTRRGFQWNLLTLLALVGLTAGMFGLWRARTVKQLPLVSGFVSFQGQPVGTAVITFHPLDPLGREGVEIIVDGRYQTDVGLLPGRYAVSIRDTKGVIPVRYHLPKTSWLFATVHDAQADSIHFELH